MQLLLDQADVLEVGVAPARRFVWLTTIRTAIAQTARKATPPAICRARVRSNAARLVGAVARHGLAVSSAPT